MITLEIRQGCCCLRSQVVSMTPVWSCQRAAVSGQRLINESRSEIPCHYLPVNSELIKREVTGGG
eukprot:scaffold6975_cov83-Skeletonema_menzelii.AAC.10